MRTLTRAGYLQGARNAQFVARLHECAGIVLPLFIIKINR
jgi:hypothetical protein